MTFLDENVRPDVLFVRMSARVRIYPWTQVPAGVDPRPRRRGADAQARDRASVRTGERAWTRAHADARPWGGQEKLGFPL
jgi:hypothetical protein